MDSSQGVTVLAPDPAADQSEITVDIIAVPGLGADPKRSFGSETGKGFNWLSDPKDGIRSDIHGARVMLYEYDSRWFGGKKAQQQTLYNAAAMFLDSLVERRKECGSRPIVFLGHSMGGLVVAKALTIAVSRPEDIERMRIYECFAGAIFFGTPFFGSPHAASAYMLAGFLELGNKAVPSQMLDALRPERDSLQELRSEFAHLATKEPAAKIACVYETEKQDFVKEAIGYRLFGNITAAFVVTQESATLDFAYKKWGMSCNHRNLNRFDNPKDGRYEIVRQSLKEIVNQARLVVKRRLNASMSSIVDDSTFSKIAGSLDTFDFRQRRRKVESISGNSAWVFKKDVFVEWSAVADAPARNKCLWITGSEGLGKSKAALAAVEHFEEKEKGNAVSGARNVTSAYFFCDSTPDSRDATTLLKSLMWQLVLKRRNLAQYVKGFAARDQSKSIGSNSFSLAELWKGLQEMLRDPSVETVYFVINNMHYLSNEEPTTREFLNMIRGGVLLSRDEIGQDPIRDKVRWMFLSRERDHINEIFLPQLGRGVLRLDMEDSSNRDDLRHDFQVFTEDRVKILAQRQKYSLALQFFVFSILSKRADYNKLWVEVVCRLLEGSPSNHIRVRKILEGLPQDLGELINRTWAEALGEILRTLSVAYEDPSISELRVLAELGDEADENRVIEHIRACGPLLRIYDSSDFGEDGIGDHKVTFTHPLARDALLGEKSSRKLIGLAEDDEDHTEVKWQHGIIALRCFAYTLGQLHADEEEFTWDVPSEDETKEQEEERELDILFPPIDNGAEDDEEVYAVKYPFKYWLRHGNESTQDFVRTLDLKHTFWARESSARRRWWKFSQEGGMEDLTGMTSLHVAAFYGLTSLVDSLLSDGRRGEIFVPHEGHIEVMRRLLQEGADINDGEQDQTWTPLHMAASNGKLDAMRFLMSWPDGATNINAVSDGEGTPLTLALDSNQKQAAELLLAAGASPTLTSNDFDSPLAVAALKAGGGRNLVSKTYGSAIVAAASAGHYDVARALLDYDQQIEWRQRALLEASKQGFSTIVRLVLQYTPSYLACNDALVAAAGEGHDGVVRELWAYHEHCRNAVTQEGIDEALYQATDNEKVSTVDILLRRGANPNTGGKEQGNAVTAAAYDANIDILHMLMRARADLNNPAGYPLQAAALEGHVEVVALLLHVFEHGTALQAASVSGHEKVVGMLLQAGADPNSGAGPYSNPLTAVTHEGQLHSLLEPLLARGADPNVLGGGADDKTTPLINAACTMPAAALETLLRYRADPNAVDPDGDTALIMAAKCGDNECIEVLLRYGARINFCGKANGSALHAAAAEGHEETCKLLLQRGADPTVIGGPYVSVAQAAATSGNKTCLSLVLGSPPKNDQALQRLNSFTALHAAAVEPDDGCLRLLLDRKPNLNSAISTGCNRNARLLLEAGADPNTAALKGETGLISIVGGKYGNPLHLLEKDFPPEALQRKDAFKLLWKSAKGKGAKKLPLNLKQLMVHYHMETEDTNSDFGDDAVNWYQDYEVGGQASANRGIGDGAGSTNEANGQSGGYATAGSGAAMGLVAGGAAGGGYAAAGGEEDDDAGEDENAGDMYYQQQEASYQQEGYHEQEEGGDDNGENEDGDEGENGDGEWDY
ncbi:ankyrin [Xylariomycetidae sp. FL2044]|nr:ankyrin [Xylariomycetidae sp. FL2044]